MYRYGGGLNAQLVLNGKGWMGHRTDTILHAGEGTVHVVRWAGSLIAWANDVGRGGGQSIVRHFMMLKPQLSCFSFFLPL